jgi:hypothetical protein
LAQVSVYDCSVINPVVNQSDVNGSYHFHQQCILFEDQQNYQFGPNDHHKVTANDNILIKENFHAGPYVENNHFWMKLEDEPVYDIAVMNYTNLENVLKFKKVEFGIDLQGELENRIKEYLVPGTSPGSIPINPFLEWDLAIKAEFQHAQTSAIRKRDFFYYHDYSVINNTWDDEIDTANHHIMRVRFAPPLTGHWQCKVSITVDGNTIELPSFAFNVVETNHPGYVKTHYNQKNLQLGSKIVFPIGHVFPGPYNNEAGDNKKPWDGPIHVDPSKSNVNVTPLEWQNYINDINNYIYQGGKTIKTVQTSYANLIEFEKLGNYYGRMHYAWEQDKILDICEQKEVLLNFNLLFQDVIMAYGQNSDGSNPEPWDYGPYGQDGSHFNTTLWTADAEYNTYCYYVPGTLPSNMFLDTVLYNDQTQPDNLKGHKLMDYHKQRTRYYVARYGYSPQIYTWELMSEPLYMDAFNHTNDNDNTYKPAQNFNHPGFAIATQAVDAYHNELSTYIKKDLSDRDHLITIDVAPWFEIENLPITSPSNTNIDVIGFNLYSPRADKLVRNKYIGINNPDNDDMQGKKNLVWWDDTEKSIYRSIRVLTSKPGYYKPIILSEVGHTDGNYWKLYCQGKTGNIIDVMTFGFSGIAGMHPWDGYKYGMPNEYDSRQLWQSTIYADIHMNSDKVISTLDNWSGQWQQGRQIQKVSPFNEERLKELQYYLSESKNLATGYVRNRSYNVWTQRLLDDCGDSTDFLDEFEYFHPDVFIENNRKLSIKGVHNHTWYQIDWYTLLSGSPTYSYFQKSDNQNRIKLTNYPIEIIGLGSPIMWFKISALGNAKSMVNEQDAIKTSNKVDENNLFPNPFTDKLNIQTDSSGQLSLYSSLGTLLYISNYRKGLTTLNLSYLSPGIYYLQLSDGTIQKVIKL